MTSGYLVRPARIDEAAVIQKHRRAMFADMGHRDERVLNAMSAHFLPWVTAKMQAREYFAWFALANDGSVAAGLGLWLMDWPPHMVGPGTRRGNILNVYTHPDHRRVGLARTLMQTALDWCRVHGIRTVILHASAEGRALYASLGFQPTNEMRLLLEDRSATTEEGLV